MLASSNRFLGRLRRAQAAIGSAIRARLGDAMTPDRLDAIRLEAVHRALPGRRWLRVLARSPGWVPRQKWTSVQIAGRLMLVSIALLVMGAVSLAGWMLVDAHRAALHQSVQTATNMLLSIEREVSRSIELGDHALQAVAEGRDQPALLRLIETANRTIQFRGPEAGLVFGPIWMADAAGLATSNAGLPAPAIGSVSDRDYFMVHRDPGAFQAYRDPGAFQANTDPGASQAHPGPAAPDGLYIGTVRGRTSGAPLLSLSRRLNHVDGSFAGVAIGAVRLTYLRAMMAALQPEPDLAVALAMRRGGTVIWLPGPGPAPGLGFVPGPGRDAIDAGRDPLGAVQQTGGDPIDIGSSPPGLAEHLAKAPGGWFTGPSSERSRASRPASQSGRVLVVYRQVEGRDLVVYAERPLVAVYAEWRRKAGLTAVAMLTLALLASALGVGLNHELSRRERAERAARQSVADLQLLAENASDLIVKLSWDGTRLFVSPACRALLGYEPDELLGRRELDLVHADDRERAGSALAGLRHGEPMEGVVYRIRRKDGCWRWFESRARRLPGNTGAAVIQRDVTTRIEMEAQLRQTQKMETMGRLTAGVAHDFNNLLQAQMGSLELLMDEVAGNEAAEEYVEMALQTAARGAQLTHHLLAFSRKQFLRAQPIELQTRLKAFSVLLRRTLGPGVKVELDIPRHVPRAFADVAELEASLLNLALNARDAMEGSGRLCIEAYRVEIADTTADGPVPGVYVVVAVADSGSGMDAATLAQAWEPFFTTKGVKGSGLGLSMVQGFCRQSGGDLRIMSAPGAGTRVEMWLPTAAAEATAPLPWSKRRTKGAGRVLVVDDAADVLVTVGAFLAGAGFEVVQVDSGERAMALLSAGEVFDALVADYAMPGMTGAELVRRALELHPRLSALMITGFAEVSGMEDLSRSVAMLRKPFRREDLVRQVVETLSQNGAAPPVVSARRRVKASPANQPGITSPA